MVSKAERDRKWKFRRGHRYIDIQVTEAVTEKKRKATRQKSLAVMRKEAAKTKKKATTLHIGQEVEHYGQKAIITDIQLGGYRVTIRKKRRLLTVSATVLEVKN